MRTAIRANIKLSKGFDLLVARYRMYVFACKGSGSDLGRYGKVASGLLRA